MRAVVTRVASAGVDVEGETVGAIDGGLLVLLGVAATDSDDDARYLAKKVVELRIFRDQAGAMNRSLLEAGGAVLAVSQFTLFGDARRGRRPSFIAAAPPERGRELYERFIGELRTFGTTVATGRFGAQMLVRSVNDGPVTILLDSTKQF
ncbi:MAG: D-aminoacyl-tRNA deacylase [Vulcanimicrobiaceae bacterium]